LAEFWLKLKNAGIWLYLVVFGHAHRP
jgi:hypothetical protein